MKNSTAGNRMLNTITQNVLQGQNLDALIVTNPYNILYLCGFKGISETEQEAVLIVKGCNFKQGPSLKGDQSGSDPVGVTGIQKSRSHLALRDKEPSRFLTTIFMTLITAKLYQAEARKVESNGVGVRLASERDQILKYIFEQLKDCQKIGFEERSLTVAQYNQFKELLPGKDLIPTKNIIENLRMVKTEDEVKKIEKAQIISQKALEFILPTVEIGQTEEEIARKLESAMQSLGGNGLAFPTIIASGPNSGLPHHLTDKRKIKKGDTLLFDFGCKYRNYCADLSRTVFVGKPSDRQVNIYQHVQNAQKSVLSKIEKEIKCRDAYDLAGDVFKGEKLHDYFIHGLGHGIGLEVHEPPYLRASSSDEEILDEGMVFSVEPGLYFPWGGVRIEDLAVIEKETLRVLGDTQKEIVIL